MKKIDIKTLHARELVMSLFCLTVYGDINNKKLNTYTVMILIVCILYDLKQFLKHWIH